MAGIFPSNESSRLPSYIKPSLGCHFLSNQALAAIFYQTKPWLPFSMKANIGCHFLSKQTLDVMAAIFCHTIPRLPISVNPSQALADIFCQTNYWLLIFCQTKPWLPFSVKPSLGCHDWHILSHHALAISFCQTKPWLPWLIYSIKPAIKSSIKLSIGRHILSNQALCDIYIFC